MFRAGLGWATVLSLTVRLGRGPGRENKALSILVRHGLKRGAFVRRVAAGLMQDVNQTCLPKKCFASAEIAGIPALRLG